jgi:hypothetical protein
MTSIPIDLQREMLTNMDREARDWEQAFRLGTVSFEAFARFRAEQHAIYCTLITGEKVPGTVHVRGEGDELG